jgi:hypothetical protein
MKIKLNIKQQIDMPIHELEEKIDKYLKENSYRILERGNGFIYFINDEFSNRKGKRSDIHSRIGEGKFEFYSNDHGTFVKLIYLTPILYPFLIIMAFIGIGIHVKSITPVLMSFAFCLPVIYRIYYLNDHVFNEILEC